MTGEGDFDQRLRTAERKYWLRQFLKHWRVIPIVAGVIMLLAYGFAYSATPFVQCITGEGVANGQRLKQGMRADFPRRIVAVKLDDGRIVDVTMKMSDEPRMRARMRVESCTKTVWSVVVERHVFMGYVGE